MSQTVKSGSGLWASKGGSWRQHDIDQSSRARAAHRINTHVDHFIDHTAYSAVAK